MSNEQIKKTSGCGSSFWFALPFRLPKAFIGRAIWCGCNWHDLGYQDIGSLRDKLQHDTELVQTMIDDAMYHSRFPMREVKLAVADVTWWALGTYLSQLCWLSAQRAAMKAKGMI